MKRRTYRPVLQQPEVDWFHNGFHFRVRLSPQGPRTISDEKVVFEWQPELDGPWERFDVNPAAETFADAALMLDVEAWRELIRNLPPAWEDFLSAFLFQRLEALAVLSHCPALLPHLEASPALTSFLAAHVALRGTDGPRWSEINAVYERGNIYAVLEWLGLPACPQTMAILAEEPDVEIPRSHLTTVRAALWSAAAGHPLAA